MKQITSVFYEYLRIAFFRFRHSITLLFAVVLLFLSLDVLFPVLIRVDFSTQILDKNDEVLHAFLTKDQKWRMRITLDEVNPVLIKTIIRKEDQWFWYHPGVNILSVIRAAWQNTLNNQRISGASTITMQVVRLLEPRERTHLNKLIEIFRAIQLEFHYSKKEILELYLNLLPYGGNIEGIKAASLLYFGQKPIALSTAQIITLAVIPNNPKHLRLGVNNKSIKYERNKWLTRLAASGRIDESDLASALSESLDVSRLPAPQKVPHFALRLINLYPDLEIIRTYIDPLIQSQVEVLLKDEISGLRLRGISNCALVIFNNNGTKIVAYAGSAGFSEVMYQGQVDGASALRSPGSALKPFLYALALDKGIITPKTMLEDVPSNFGGYRPLNYDETYRGRLTATQALALSLNIPAVDLANRMGVNLFLDKLERGGLTWIAARKKQLGLSVVLGGCGVTLEELTALYTSLASYGCHQPVSYCRSDNQQVCDTLFSSAASWMITEMLTNLKRPDLPDHFESSQHLPHIAWKTGTSYGRRDAWSIGYNPDYTVGVWAGNFDGTGIADLSGSDVAAPILFKMFNMLNYKKNPRWFKESKDIDYRLVCSESGCPPNEFCENLVMDHYIPSVSSNKKCNHFVEVIVNPSATESYCRSCAPDQGFRMELYPNYSPRLISFYEAEHIPFKKIPPHNSMCNRIVADENPVITSLDNEKEYLLYPEAAQSLQLACSAAADVSKVYWYVNNRFIAEASVSEKLFFKPEAGVNKISCCDDRGRNSDITIKVTFI
jgi:penicillin-binding protein 1C